MPLGPLTTLRVGGPADRLAEPRSREELLGVLEAARAAGVPWLVIGNGSNLVVADAGVRGLVIRNRARTIEREGRRLSADAGTPMAMLVKQASGAGLAGLEWGIAVPGTLGGAVWANAGAHDGEIKDRLTSAEAWDPASGEVAAIPNERLPLRLPRLAFQARAAGGGGRHAWSSNQMSPMRWQRGLTRSRRNARATQPLAEQNAGSVFRNPPGDYAGRLIEAAGLKGLAVGTASVSTRHANFIVTERGGRAADVRGLADQVRAAVHDASGIQLEYEIEFVGAWEADA